MRQREYPPILRWIGKYSKDKNLFSDILSGTTVGILAIPQSQAYALIAGLPAQYGLYSDLQVCYPVFGTSSGLVIGPVAVMSLLIHNALSALEMDEYSDEWVSNACFFCIVVGLIQIGFARLHFGTRCVQYLSHEVVSGFTSAASLLIGSTQVATLLGVEKCKADTGKACELFTKLYDAMVKLGNGNAQRWSLFASILSLTTLWMFRVTFNRSSLLAKCGPIAVATIGISLALFLDQAEDSSPREDSLDLVGYIPEGLPIPRVPTISLDRYQLFVYLWHSIPIALVGFAEAFAIAKSTAKPDELQNLNADEELVALGVSNLWTGIIGGYPVTGSFSRTAVNVESGASTPLATIFSALFVSTVLLFFTPVLGLLPKACVASIVLFCVVKLFKLADLVNLVHTYRQSGGKNKGVIVWLVTFVTSLTSGVHVGLFYGVFLSLALKRHSSKSDAASVCRLENGIKVCSNEIGQKL